MCFSSSLSVTAQTLAHRYNVPVTPFNGKSNISAFTHPTLPTIASFEHLSFMHWGLVPTGVKTRKQAEEIRKKTLNARAETIFEKPSFRDAIHQSRCLIPVSSFQEWHHNEDGSKSKYDISVKGEQIFSLAGIYSEWVGPQSGISYFSYSVITCPANPLMAHIHNTKQRMPVIFSRESEQKWLDYNLTERDIRELLHPFEESRMSAVLQ